MADQTDDIFKMLGKFPILTISDMDNFLEKGGMISLITTQNRIKFAINRKKAKDAGIEFRAQMLKLAIKILEH